MWKKYSAKSNRPPETARAVDQDVLLGQMPAARAHEQRGGLVVQPVRLAFRTDVIDPSAHRIAQIDLALDVVVPRRRVGVLEVRHENARAGVERVDDHLAVDRAGDLDPAVLDVGRHRRAGPVGLANRARLGQEIGELAGVELRLSVSAPGQQLVAAGAERSLQARDKCHRLGCQYLGVTEADGARNRNAGTELANAHRRFPFLGVRRIGKTTGQALATCFARGRLAHPRSMARLVALITARSVAVTIFGSRPTP